MIRLMSLFAVLALFLSANSALAVDSLIVGNLVGGIPVPVYSASSFQCAVETTLANGTTISSVTIEWFGTNWILQATGSRMGNSVVVAYHLTQHGTTLWLRVANRWDQCTGSDCSGCELKRDALGRPFCECFHPSGSQPICNHSTGENSPGIIDNLLSCAM